MPSPRVAIVGAGITASTLAHLLTRGGCEVTIFEKGPEYPYPHTEPYLEEVQFLYANPRYRLPADLDRITVSGDYRYSRLEAERPMLVGGAATRWNAITLRMNPTDFKTASLFGYGRDWPVGYQDLEPYYCRAEHLLGVSGTNDDNPSAPPRSKPFPLPAFELSYDDKLLGQRLHEDGVVLHTTPQARTRQAYDGRPDCLNIGLCELCPIGSRYSPNHHLKAAVATGLCSIVSNVSVRRLELASAGRVSALVYRENDSAVDREFSADVYIVACGAIESARLLLLSSSSRAPDGLGNSGGHVGRNLTFHHLWSSELAYGEQLFPARVGPLTGQVQQFANPPARGNHGGIKIEFSSSYSYRLLYRTSQVVEGGGRRLKTGADVIDELGPIARQRVVIFHSESDASPQKQVTLSPKRDRFGDPFAHVQYKSSAFDQATHEYAVDLLHRFATATGGDPLRIPPLEEYNSGAHHMSTCRMGDGPDDSVVDTFGQVHGVRNLFVLGASNFPGTSGAVNPALTHVALSLRSGDRIMELVG